MDSVLLLVLIGALTLAVVLSAFAWRALRRERDRSSARVARLQGLSSDEPVMPAWEPPAAPARGGSTVLVVVVFMAIGAGTVYGLYGPGWTAQGNSGDAATASPLELVSLAHRRDAGDFVVTGLVQNGDTRAQTPPLSAVVYLFDADGQYLTSATRPLDTGRVHAADVSPFTVRVPAAGAVARYRVGFRRDDGATFPHVDRRAEGISGTTMATVEAHR